MQLNMADMSYILLNEELSRIEYYLNLEQMRFGDKLQWSINVTENINTGYLEIPNMIIQPFVENSIWHGIMPSSEKGFVTIDISLLDNGNIQILISDNGVGFDKSATGSHHGHQSKGMKLIGDRLRLIDPDASEFLHFTSNNPGSIVTLILTPAMYKYKTPVNVSAAI
jgi:LytS/YehU family sensor histidine kinase